MTGVFMRSKFFKTLFWRIFMVGLTGATLKCAFGLDGEDKDKFRTVINAKGEEERVEIPVFERLAKETAKNSLSILTGGLVGIRDISSMAVSRLFNGERFGREVSLGSLVTDGMNTLGKAYVLMDKMEETNAKADETDAKRATKAKFLREEKLEEHKNKTPPKRISYSEIARELGGGLTMMFGARFGISKTLSDGLGNAVMYLNDNHNRYTDDWHELVWSIFFNKRLPKKEKAETAKTKGRERRNK